MWFYLHFQSVNLALGQDRLILQNPIILTSPTHQAHVDRNQNHQMIHSTIREVAVLDRAHQMLRM